MSFKVCSICKESKSSSDYNKNSRKSDGLQTHCRDCSKKKCKDYYSLNKANHKKVISARKRKVVLELKQFIYDFAKLNGCFDCGEKDPCCLDFDHNRDKKFNISQLVNSGCSFATLMKEIDKCTIRCANCHRRKTAKQQNWYKNIRT
jgi:hypothetical protein